MVAKKSTTPALRMVLIAVEKKAKETAAAIREIDKAAGEESSKQQEPSAQPTPESTVEQVLT